MNAGTVFAFGAYALWGLFPLYFRMLRGVPALDVLMHRVVWSVVFIALVLVVVRRWRWIADAVRSPRVLLQYAICALLIGVNWFVYIWSVQNGHVVDASLGYFVTPLVSVLLGRVVLGERPRPAQWAAIAVASLGVVWLGLLAGHVPWIGLALALSFGGYGLAKKTATLGALEGLALETSLMFPVALAVLVWLATHGQDAFAESPPHVRWLLMGTGPMTVLALLLFAAGARRIPLATLGVLQYVSPTLQLLVGVLVFGEAFGGASLVGYGMIWSALLLYAADGIARARRAAAIIVPR